MDPNSRHLIRFGVQLGIVIMMIRFQTFYIIREQLAVSAAGDNARAESKLTLASFLISSY